MPEKFVKGLSLALVLCCFMAFLLPSQAHAEGETPVFAAPEDTIRHFAAGIAENDLQKMLQSCAIPEYADGYDFAGMMERINAFIPHTQMGPSEFGLFRDINRMIAEGTLANQIKITLYSFFVPETKEGLVMYSGTGSREKAEEFLKAVDPAQLKDLKLLRIDPPRKDILESERNIANFQKMADIFGAQEMTERIALYQLNDKTYLGGFILLRYGESWKIYSLCSNLAGTSVMGGVEQISIMDYALLL